jgi:glycosyltransferase involved in cell wall biosynthesis
VDQFGVESEFVPYGAPVIDQIPSNRVEALGLTPGSFVLAVARLIPENNIDLILDSIERTAPQAPAVIVGSANFDAPIEARLRKLDHAGKVRWLGHVSDQDLLSQLWAHAGVYLHGHSVGGTNPGLLQALGAGAPTLALDTVFNREVIGADDQLFDGNADALASRITEVLRDHALRAELAKRGRAIVAERYSWPDIADRYREALGLARARRLG